MVDEPIKSGRPTASLSDILSSLVRSLADAQRAADLATIDQLFQIGLEKSRAGPSKIRMLEIQADRTGVDGKLEKHILSVPLAGLAPPSHLRVKSAEITFDFNVTDAKPATLASQNAAPQSRYPIEFMGYIVQNKTSQSMPTPAVPGDLQAINFKFLIESAPLSDNFGALLDQIANSFHSKVPTKRDKPTS